MKIMIPTQFPEYEALGVSASLSVYKNDRVNKCKINISAEVRFDITEQ